MCVRGQGKKTIANVVRSLSSGDLHRERERKNERVVDNESRSTRIVVERWILPDDLRNDLVPNDADRADDLGFILDSPGDMDIPSPKSAEEASISLRSAIPDFLEREVGRMEISPLSGPGIRPPFAMKDEGGTRHRTGVLDETSLVDLQEMTAPKHDETNEDAVMESLWESIAADIPDMTREDENARSPSWDDGMGDLMASYDLDGNDSPLFKGTGGSPTNDSQKRTTKKKKKATKSRRARKSKSPTPSMKVKTESQKEPITLEAMDKKRTRRLERNRVSARMSRRRKKMVLETLSERMRGIMSQITHHRKQCLREMVNAVDDGNVGRSTSRERQVIASHFDVFFRENMLPLRVKFLLWLTTALWNKDEALIAKQNAMFKKSPEEIWRLLAKQIDLTESQGKKIMSQVDANKNEKSAADMKEFLKREKFIRRLRFGVQQNSRRAETIRSDICKMLSDVQQKYVASQTPRETKPAMPSPQEWSPTYIENAAGVSDMIALLRKPRSQLDPDSLNRMMSFVASTSAPEGKRD